MSEFTLTVIDAERAIHGRAHGGVVDRLVASLGADPATIDELDLASRRFCYLQHGQTVFPGFCQGFCDEPWDAGVVIIDLAARLVASQSTYSSFLREGGELWHDGRSLTDHQLAFHLAPDWMFSDNVDCFDWISRDRRAKLFSKPRIDQRAVLYGQFPEYLVRQVWRRREGFAERDADVYDRLVREIHSEWLLTPRVDLSGLSPREAMIDDRHKHIVWDLQDQQFNWSMLRRQPPGLRRDSVAYQFGGFGTCEIVLYYDLVRELFAECVQRLQERRYGEDQLPDEIEHLKQYSQDWLNKPNEEDFSGRTPAAMIDQERRRLPQKVCGEEAIIDPECPCCQTLADEETFGPAFWCMDGCNMDDEFAFSFCGTLAEWEEEQRRHEEYMREWERKQAAGELPPLSDDIPF